MQVEKFKKANKYIKEDTVWSYFIQVRIRFRVLQDAKFTKILNEGREAKPHGRPGDSNSDSHSHRSTRCPRPSPVALQICQGLNAMHSRNVLHRDIKSKNIFLTGKCHVRLGDLGCAKLLKAGMAKTQIGTPYYMSPEIWSNKPYDAKAGESCYACTHAIWLFLFVLGGVCVCVCVCCCERRWQRLVLAHHHLRSSAIDGSIRCASLHRANDLDRLLSTSLTAVQQLTNRPSNQSTHLQTCGRWGACFTSCACCSLRSWPTT